MCCLYDLFFSFSTCILLTQCLFLSHLRSLALRPGALYMQCVGSCVLLDCFFLSCLCSLQFPAKCVAQSTLQSKYQPRATGQLSKLVSTSCTEFALEPIRLVHNGTQFEWQNTCLPCFRLALHCLKLLKTALLLQVYMGIEFNNNNNNSSLQTLHSIRILLCIACRTFSFLAPPECLFSMISFHGVLHCKLV